MRKFPGKVELVKEGRVHRLALNDQQVRWLRKWFPIIENKRLAIAMSISLSKLHDFSREYGLVKSAEGMKAIKERQTMAMVKTNEKNGCYDRKRGHPVSEATIAGRAKRFEEERMGLRENAQLRIKRENPEKYKEWMRKRSVERKESIRKEKMRVIYGLPRKTKLKAVVMCPFSRSQTHHRSNALKRGYILTEDCSEGNPDRYIVYYDDLTERSEKFEQNLIKDGFKVVERKNNVKMNNKENNKLAV